MAEDEKGTEVAPIFGGSVEMMDQDKLMGAMETTKDEGGRAGDISYMSFSGKKGTYSIGVDGRSHGDDEPWLVAITSFELGWICWKGGKPKSKRMANINAPQIVEPDPEEFGPFDKDGEGWHRARAITVRSFDNMEQAYFSINSKSGVAVISDLQRDVLANMKAGQPCWPVVVFGSETFESNGYKNEKPTLEVIKWLSTEDVQMLADPEFDPNSLLDEDVQEEAPAPRRRRNL